MKRHPGDVTKNSPLQRRTQFSSSYESTRRFSDKLQVTYICLIADVVFNLSKNHKGYVLVNSREQMLIGS